jgi:hypothetical protein
MGKVFTTNFCHEKVGFFPKKRALWVWQKVYKNFARQPALMRGIAW